jgi:hypothetical protein
MGYPMPRDYVASGFVRHGKLKLRQKLAFERACAQWPDGEVIVRIEPARATRSRPANALYWAGYVAPLAAHANCSPLEMHAYLKKRFLPAQHRVLIHDQFGEVVDDVQLEALTTTTLTKDEFQVYLTDIAAFAFTLGVTLDPSRTEGETHMTTPPKPAPRPDPNRPKPDPDRPKPEPPAKPDQDLPPDPTAPAPIAG